MTTLLLGSLIPLLLHSIDNCTILGTVRGGSLQAVSCNGCWGFQVCTHSFGGLAEGFGCRYTHSDGGQSKQQDLGCQLHAHWQLQSPYQSIGVLSHGSTLLLVVHIVMASHLGQAGGMQVHIWRSYLQIGVVV